jgi:hypothetical protein
MNPPPKAALLFLHTNIPPEDPLLIQKDWSPPDTNGYRSKIVHVPQLPTQVGRDMVGHPCVSAIHCTISPEGVCTVDSRQGNVWELENGCWQKCNPGHKISLSGPVLVYHNKGYKIWVTLYKASSTGDVKNAQGSRDTTEEFASLREQLQSAHSQIARLKLDLDHSTQQLDHSTQQYVALHEFQAKQMRKRAKAAAGDAESASCSREPGQQKRKISELESTIIKLQNERHSPDLQVKPVIDSGGHSPDLQVKPVIDSGDDDKQVKEASQQASSPYQQGYPPEWRDGSAGTFSNDEDFA